MSWYDCRHTSACQNKESRKILSRSVKLSLDQSIVSCLVIWISLWWMVRTKLHWLNCFSKYVMTNRKNVLQRLQTEQVILFGDEWCFTVTADDAFLYEAIKKKLIPRYCILFRFFKNHNVFRLYRHLASLLDNIRHKFIMTTAIERTEWEPG